MAELAKILQSRQEDGLLRVLKPAQIRKQGKIYFPEGEYWDFSSNDYLGLSRHPKLIQSGIAALEKFGASGSASRLLSGDLSLFHRLEERLAAFKHKEAALVFNSGYQANLGTISALLGRGDCVFSDRLIHASIIDGILLSQAKPFRFPHNDADYLEGLLKKERGKFRRALIATEGVFSMDGDQPPLKELVSLKQRYNCLLLLDEAHAFGVFGERGSGIAEERGLEQEVDLLMGTFGKALGSCGAYLAASRETIDYLINVCRSFIYSTALPPQVIAANLAAIELIETEPYRRKGLLEQAGYFRNRLLAQGFMVKGESQIVPLIIGDNLRAQNLSRRLKEKGYWVPAIRPPTVPVGQARLRFSLSFDHPPEALERLLDDIRKIPL